MRTTNFNRNKYVVLLIGASRYDTNKYNDIPNVESNIEQMKEIFIDKRFIGVNSKHVIVSLNEDVTTIKHRIIDASKMAKDSDYTLFVYYSGHGIISPENYKLYFATSNMNPKYFDSEALDARYILDKISRSSAVRKIFVVDACHSGGIHNTMGVAPEVTLMKNYEGVHYVSACDEDSTALFPKKQPDLPTYFTGAILDRVRNGMDVSTSYLTLREIVDDIALDFSLRNLPKPQQSSILNVTNMPFVNNVRAVDLPKNVATDNNNGKVFETISVSTSVIDNQNNKKDKNMWKSVCENNTIDKYNEYIVAFPNGIYYNEAVAKIDALMSEKANIRKSLLLFICILACLMTMFSFNAGKYSNFMFQTILHDTTDTSSLSTPIKRTIVTEDEWNASSNEEKGDIVSENGDLKNALQHYKDALEEDPNNANIKIKVATTEAAVDSAFRRHVSIALSLAVIPVEKKSALEEIDIALSIKNDDVRVLDLRNYIEAGDQSAIKDFISKYEREYVNEHNYQD